MSVPPSFSASAGDHVGLLLHPLFPHAHGSAATPFVQDGAPRLGDSTSPTSDHEVRAIDQVPGLRGQPADEGLRSAVGGIVLPAILAGLLLHLRQLRHAELRLAQQPWRGPPSPPPRRLPLAH